MHSVQLVALAVFADVGIYSSEEPSLPAPPFVASVEAGAAETQALGVPG